MTLRSEVEVELLTRFADGLDVGGVGKEGSQDGSYVCSLGNWGGGIYREGKMGVGTHYLQGWKPIQPQTERWATDGLWPLTLVPL